MTGMLDVELPLRTPNIQDQLRLASREVHGPSHITSTAEVWISYICVQSQARRPGSKT